jgi:hypothetical protein
LHRQQENLPHTASVRRSKIYGCEMIRISSRGGRLPPQQTTFGPNESYAAVGLRDTANNRLRQQQAARDIWGHLRSPFNKEFLDF